MKILIDMNLSPRWATVLTGADFGAEHWSAIGAADTSDTEIMHHAAAHDFVVLTHDLDFGSILAATGGGKPSVVQIRAGDVSPEAIGDQVVRALRQMRAELERDALVAVDPGRARLRLLPLRRGE